MDEKSSVKEQVREQYARAAQRVSDGSEKSACCEVDRLISSGNPITSNLYEDQEIADLPAGAIAASLGCGNPAALAELKPGEVVLDLGQAAESMSCSPPAASAHRGKPMDST